MRLLVVLALGAFGLLASASPSFASPSTSPLGEQLTADALSSVVVTPADCDGSTPSTFSFVATGAATGPYPGTFQVQATYTIGTHDLSGISNDVTYDESFTIVSGDTTITGTATVATGDTGPYYAVPSGQCEVFDNIWGQHGRLVWGSGLMRYHATIQDSTGTSTWSGLSGTTALDERYENAGPIADRSFFLRGFATVDPDTTAPTVNVPADLSVPATSLSGASVTFAVSATDDRDSNPSLSCSPGSGSVFPIGDTTVTCTATDGAGNTTVASFVVHVSGDAAEQAAALANLVLATNAKQGIVNSLDAKLGAVQQALTAANAGNRADAASKLNAFINDVAAQSGKALTADQAAQLISTAKQIQALLG